MKILDCTLRDGGYYCNWDFDRELVDAYLKSIEYTEVKIIELGFRFLNKNIFCGAYGYTTDDHINSLNIPDSVDIAVMINLEDYKDNDSIEENISKSFNKKENSKVSLVRIALKIDQLDEAKNAAQLLKDLGYKVALNLMQVSKKTVSNIEIIQKQISSFKDTIDMIYFADSFGSLDPRDCYKLIKAAKKAINIEIGIHCHDNKGLAFANSLEAIKAGVDWCDATILGMGRGSGNTPLESLLIEISTEDSYKFSRFNKFSSILDSFKKLKSEYGWGYNSYYHYSALKEIHPSYVQQSLEISEIDSPAKIFNQLSKIEKSFTKSYSHRILRDALYGTSIKSKGDWNPSGWLKGKDVILIGGGVSTRIHNDAIVNFIKKNKPFVAILNLNNNIPDELVDVHIVSNDAKAISDSIFLDNNSKKIILPKDRLQKMIDGRISDSQILNFGLEIGGSGFKINSTGVIMPWTLSPAYALAIFTKAIANKIFLVGFDGYSSENPLQKNMNEIFSAYKELPDSLEIISLTPSSYNVNQGSIYQPNIT